jgi:hypothetical protein
VKFTRIDDLYRAEHHFLRSDDDCYFLREYTAGKGYAGSDTNNTISNLKKSPLKRGTPEWPHKERAVKNVADELRAALTSAWARRATFVPIPPSCARSHPEYDDRMTQVLLLAGKPDRLDVRELLVCKTTLPASHKSDRRARPAEILANYEVVESSCVPPPVAIALVDDVLTAGAHFRAAKDLLTKRFAGIRIVGLFYARTIRPPEDDLGT